MKDSKNKKAAALQYNPETDQAPRLIAYGEGEIAEKIIQIARENKIPFYQDHTLIELLSTIEIGSEIPEEAYQVVAEILAFIYRLSQKKI
ncbi:hypothetical protein BBF96_05195 [Anoxybacter fermentans]|uniref:Flagellar biosynthesis protein FlhB n=1 Tax=Anoxybacter fermentans TaxID=1323375 RepID=A0A3Q9HPR0_9FIRM|nr:EscU/YscU/HrcU family type III secretion system export apparatus switch protein [Anoxybacter fermentans]AZR72838.1 hypothetical protein BBF96_05195 [Anoxybacter fermentans]